MRTLLFLVIAVLFLSVCGCTPKTELPSAPAESLPPSDSPKRETGTLELDGRRYCYTGAEGDVEAKDDALILRRGGIYRISGTLSEGRLQIAVDRGETVHLLLDGVSIRSGLGTPLEILQAACVILETVGDSVNTLTDDGETDGTEEGAACVSAACPLVLRGTGSLIVSGRRQDGISGANQLTLESGRLTVSAEGRAVAAGSLFLQEGGSLTVITARQGIVSRPDSCKDCQSGVVEIRGGSVTLSCSETAILAGETISISGGYGSLDAPKRYACGQVNVYREFLKKTGSP